MKIHRPHLLKHTFNVVNRVRQTASVAGLSALRVAKGEKPDAMLLKETFEQLGTTYIKIGQFIASTPSLFPRDYVTAFQSFWINMCKLIIKRHAISRQLFS